MKGKLTPWLALAAMIGILAGYPKTAAAEAAAESKVMPESEAASESNATPGSEVTVESESVSETPFDEEGQTGAWFTKKKTSDGRGYIITGLSGEAPAEIGTLIIPAQLEENGTTLPVAEIASMAFYGKNTITGVNFSSATSLTTIGSFAFQSCTGLTELIWPTDNHITKIGEKAFAGCTALTAVELPEKLTTLNGQAFADCTSLSEVTIPSTLTMATDRPFYGDMALKTIQYRNGITEIAGRSDAGYGGLFTGTGLEQITIPDSVVRIGREAFSQCTLLNRITFSNAGKLTRIEAEAFSGCTALESVTLPQGLSLLGLKCFSGCTGLTSVTIPSTLGAYANCPFYGDDALKNVTLSEGLTTVSGHYHNDYGVEYGGLLAYSGIETIELPNSVTTIGEEAFHGCTELASIRLTESVTKIEEGAFYGCTALTRVSIPKSVTEIGKGAFENCTGVTSVSFAVDKSCTSEQTLGEAAFRGCTALQRVELGNRIRKLCINTFSGDTALEELTVPHGVTEIEENAFRGCSSLSVLFIPASVTTLNTAENEFSRGSLDTTIYVEAGSESAAKTLADGRAHWNALDGIWGMESVFGDEKLRSGIDLLGVDKNLDTRLTLREIEGITELDLSSREIEDPSGLQIFTGLTELDISGNRLTTLTADGGSVLNCLPNLERLNCARNQLTDLDLSGNPALKKLDCSHNRISLLDLSLNPSLEELDCSENALLALDLTANSNLTAPVLGSQSGTGRVTDADDGRKRLALQEIYGTQYSANSVTSLTDDYPDPEGTEDPTVEAAGFVWETAYQVPDRLTYRYRVYYGRGWNEMPVTAQIENAGIRPDSTEFREAYPDGNFSHRLSALLDENGNGLISRTEERQLRSLLLNNARVTSLAGIDRLWSLEELNAAGDFLKELDLSGNKELITLDVTDNHLTSLDLSNQEKLKSLSVAGNRLAVVGLKASSALNTFNGGTQETIRVKGSLNESATALVVSIADYDPLWDGNHVLSATAYDEAGGVLTGSATPVSDGFLAPLATKSIVYSWGINAANCMTVTAAVGDVSVPEIMEIRFLSSDGEVLCDPVTGTKGNAIGALPTPADRTGYRFMGWYTGVDGTGERVDAATILTDQYILFAWYKPIEEGELDIDPVDSVVYTGQAQKPQIHVYDGGRELVKGKDYTVKYSNNTNAGLATITVTGKGQYRGSTLVRFPILPKPLTDEDILVWEEKLTMIADGGFKSPVPAVSWGKRKLKTETEYTVTYPDQDSGAYRAAGEHDITLVGQGNFTGSRTVSLTLVDPGAGKTLVNNAVVNGITSILYTGEAVEPKPTAVRVGKKYLFEGTNYRLKYVNNDAVGVAAVRIVGINDCAGSKLIPFTLKGTSMGRTVVTGLGAQIFDGTEKQPVPVVRVKDELTPLRPGVDYVVSYSNNIVVGTARVVITGMGRMTGSITRTFKIKAYDIGSDTGGRMTVDGQRNGAADLTGAWERGGARPDFRLCMGSLTLTKGTDYSVTRSNNKRIGNIATAVYTGKGNYKGKLTVQYRVVQGKLDEAAGSAADVVYNGKAGRWSSSPVFRDSTGTKLSAGTHYDRKLAYAYAQVPEGAGIKVGDTPKKTDLVPPGTVISVTATGRGGYAGSTAVVSYRIVEASIAKASIALKEQEWNGSAFTLEELLQKGTDAASLFKTPPTVKIGGKVCPISYGTDFEVVPGSYRNNTQTGTASVTLRGISNQLGGTRVVKFKLTKRGLEQVKVAQ